MNKYEVKYIVLGAEASDSWATGVEADHYDTQATNGAGLVADFFGTPAAALPSSTFSHVVSVKKVSEEGVFLTNTEARIAYNALVTYDARAEGYEAVRIKLVDAFATAPRPEEGSGGTGQVPWNPKTEPFPPGTFNSSEHDPS